MISDGDIETQQGGAAYSIQMLDEGLSPIVSCWQVTHHADFGLEGMLFSMWSSASFYKTTLIIIWVRIKGAAQSMHGTFLNDSQNRVNNYNVILLPNQDGILLQNVPVEDSPPTPRPHNQDETTNNQSKCGRWYMWVLMHIDIADINIYVLKRFQSCFPFWHAVCTNCSCTL